MGSLMKQEGVVLTSPTTAAGKPDYDEFILNALHCHRTMLDVALSQFSTRTVAFTRVAALLIHALRIGHKVFVAGNGGSATEAQHFAAELVGRFKRERPPFAVLSLTTDTAILTAVANDYGYEEVFARQILGLGLPGDVFIAFSTSGESENLLKAATAAQQRLMTVVAITGDQPSHLESLADLTVRVPAVDTAVAQELHMIVTHVLCDLIETELMDCAGDDNR